MEIKTGASTLDLKPLQNKQIISFLIQDRFLIIWGKQHVSPLISNFCNVTLYNSLEQTFYHSVLTEMSNNKITVCVITWKMKTLWTWALCSVIHFDRLFLTAFLQNTKGFWYRVVQEVPRLWICLRLYIYKTDVEVDSRETYL